MNYYNSVMNAKTAAETALAEAQTDLEALSGNPGGVTVDEEAVRKAEEKLAAAAREAEAMNKVLMEANLTYTGTAELVAEAEAAVREADRNKEDAAAEAVTAEESAEAAAADVQQTVQAVEAGEATVSEMEEQLAEAEQTVTAAEEAVETAAQEVTKAEEKIAEAGKITAALSTAETQLKEAKASCDSAKKAYDTAKKTYDSLQNSSVSETASALPEEKK